MNVSNVKDAALAVLAWRKQEMEGKSPLRSRTIWAILVTGLSMYLAQYVGVTLNAEEQTAIVAAVGIVMRLVTKSPVGFWEDVPIDVDAGGPK